MVLDAYSLLPLTSPFQQTVTTAVLTTHVRYLKQQSKRVKRFCKKLLVEILMARMMLSWATRLPTRSNRKKIFMIRIF
jgi:hypothetical protein